MNYIPFIRVVPDFPKEGISFKDISPLLKDSEAFKSSVDDMAKLVKKFNPTVIVGPEARGFVFGTAIAYSLGVGFVMARKEGKLPGEPLKITYGLEYGSDTITIPENLLKPTDRVVIVDDLLATGGTICALAKLCKSTGAKVVGAVTFIELEGLDGKKVLAEEEVPFEVPLLL